VHTSIDGDTFFPEIEPTVWERVWHEAHPADERHAFAYTFEIYERSR
jgi:dihydrofolate reductase